MFDLTFAIILCAYNIQCILYYIEWAKAISINLLLLINPRHLISLTIATFSIPK